MSYATSGLNCLVPGMGDGRAIWVYASNDAHADVDATDYFDDALEKGLKAGDIVLVIDIDTATFTSHFVTAVDADGNGTISAATLA